MKRRRAMEHLSRNEFSLCKRASESMRELLNEKDMAYVRDRMLEMYDEEIVELVLAATINSNIRLINAPEYKQSSKQWAEQYRAKIGFLSELVCVKYPSVGKIEELLYCMAERK